MKMISFGRVKDILASNVQAISDRICGESQGSLMAHALLGAMKSYMDGKPVRAGRIASMMEDKIREFIQSADVRCLDELLKLLPKGCDNRLPGWLYGPVNAYIEDDGWVLVPRAV